MNINNLTISGWVQTDPEEGSTKNGKRFVRFKVMNYKKYQRPDNTFGESRFFFDVVAWGDNIVDKVLDNVHKNSEVIMDGSLNINVSQDQEGKKYIKPECSARSIDVVETGEMPPSPTWSGEMKAEPKKAVKASTYVPTGHEDDDIPF